MRERFFRFSFVVLALALLAGCVTTPALFSTKDHPPVMLGRAVHDFNGDGKDDTLSVVWIGGRHYVDEEPWCGEGRKYTGQFAFRIALGGGATMDTTFESRGLGSDDGDVFFRVDSDHPFRIVTADYNHDGRTDFNVGFNADCNYSTFRLFTVRPSGQVVPLRIEDRDELTLVGHDESTDEFDPTPTGRCYGTVRFGIQEHFKVSLDWDVQRQFFHVREEKWNPSDESDQASAPVR